MYFHTVQPTGSECTGGERLYLLVYALLWMNYQAYSLLPMSKHTEHTVHKHSALSTTQVQILHVTMQ